MTQLFTDSCSSLIQKIASRVRGPSSFSDVDSNAPRTSAVPKEDETPRCLKSAVYDEEKRRAQRSIGRKSTGRKRVEGYEEATRWFGRSPHPTGPLPSPVGEERRPMRKKDLDIAKKKLEVARREIEVSRKEVEASRREIENARRKSTAGIRSLVEDVPGQLAKSATTVVLAEKAYPFVATVPTAREKTPFRRRKSTGGGQSELRPVVLDIPTEEEPLSERAVRRKEIQSLIMKYCSLEDKKSAAGGAEEVGSPPTTALAKCRQKYSGILSRHTVSVVY